MRQITLLNIANSQTSHGESQAFEYDHNGCITSPTKSLDILRKNIQAAFNKDIDYIIKKYVEKFFFPAINNIRVNQGKDSVNDEHLRIVCCQMLEEAKTLYCSETSSENSSQYVSTDSETGSISEEHQSPAPAKRRTSSASADQPLKRLKASGFAVDATRPPDAQDYYVADPEDRDWLISSGTVSKADSFYVFRCEEPRPDQDRQPVLFEPPAFMLAKLRHRI